MADIFISYVHEDCDIAKSVATFLRNKGHTNIFFTGDDWLLYAGEVWLKRIREELSDAKVVLCLFSGCSIERQWIHFEVGAAWLADRVIVPVCVGRLTTNDLRIPYSGIQGITLTDASSAYYLVRSIWNHLKPEKPAKWGDVVPSIPFGPDDKDWKELEPALKKTRERDQSLR
jgi:hypothetical protein